MKHNLTENQLRSIIYNAIKESVYGDEMYFIEDEADGGIYSNVADKEEAIADAQEMASRGGRYLVKDRNDNVIFDTGGASYKFESKEIKCNESRIRNLVSNIIQKSLFNVPHTEYNQNSTIEDCLKNDGWNVLKSNQNIYKIEQMTSFAGSAKDDVLPLVELVKDLTMFIQDNNLGRSVKVLKKGRIGDSKYGSVGEVAIIQII